MVSAINVPFGFNFGFMGDSLPGHPSVLDFLGLWPLRLVWVVLIVGTLWAVMTVPFGIRRAAIGTADRSESDPGWRIRSQARLRGACH